MPVRSYIRPSVRPQSFFDLMKFGMWIEVDE